MVTSWVSYGLRTSEFICTEIGEMDWVQFKDAIGTSVEHRYLQNLKEIVQIPTEVQDSYSQWLGENIQKGINALSWRGVDVERFS